MDAFALKYEEKRVKTIVKGLIPVSAPKAHSNSGYVAWKTHTKDFMDLVERLGKKEQIFISHVSLLLTLLWLNSYYQILCDCKKIYYFR